MGLYHSLLLHQVYLSSVSIKFNIFLLRTYKIKGQLRLVDSLSRAAYLKIPSLQGLFSLTEVRSNLDCASRLLR